jgi:hypothetical protein
MTYLRYVDGCGHARPETTKAAPQDGSREVETAGIEPASAIA